jgi:hypothetical protein
MTPDVRVMFALGERLHMSVAAVERLSAREIRGWLDYFADRQQKEQAAAAPPDPDADAIPLRLLNKAARRAAFHH